MASRRGSSQTRITEFMATIGRRRFSYATINVPKEEQNIFCVIATSKSFSNLIFCFCLHVAFLEFLPAQWRGILGDPKRKWMATYEILWFFNENFFLIFSRGKEVHHTIQLRCSQRISLRNCFYRISSFTLSFHVSTLFDIFINRDRRKRLKNLKALNFKSDRMQDRLRPLPLVE